MSDDGNMRGFNTGATRDTAEGKLLYNKFLAPNVLTQYAKFMSMNRLQSNGELRDGNNWQKGIPMDVYEDSMARHYHEFWTMYEDRDNLDRADEIEMIGSAMGLLFNVMGWTLEWLKQNEMVDFDGDEPTEEMRERQGMIATDPAPLVKQPVSINRLFDVMSGIIKEDYKVKYEYK